MKHWRYAKEDGEGESVSNTWYISIPTPQVAVYSP